MKLPAWEIGSLCSRTGPDASRRRFVWTCLDRVTSPIRSWRSSQARSWRNSERRRNHERRGGKPNAALRSWVLHSHFCRVANALHLWSDSRLFISVAASGGETTLGTGERRTPLAEHQSDADSNGNWIRHRRGDGIVHRVADGNE